MRNRLVLMRNLTSLVPVTLIAVLACDVVQSKVIAVSTTGFVSEHEIQLIPIREPWGQSKVPE